MTDLRKTAEMALEALEILEKMQPNTTACAVRIPAIQALRQALAEPANSTTDFVEPKASSQTEQEPVMYIDGKRLAQGMPNWKPGMVFKKPKREWVGLTEEDAIDLLPVGEWEIESTLKFAKSIEAKLKEKNA